LCSGGKDSAFALWLAINRGYEVRHLVAMIPKREDSWMFHYPNIKLVDLFAECASLPLIKAETGGERELELEDLKQALRGLDVEGVVSGAIASNYQRNRIDSICMELGLKSIAPLWGQDSIKILQNIVKNGFEAIVTSVSAEGLDESWLGRKIDDTTIRELIGLNSKYGVNPCGEGGEYESLVLDAPFFKRRIELNESVPIWRGTDGYLLIKRAKTVEK